jgi:hypothetical protein
MMDIYEYSNEPLDNIKTENFWWPDELYPTDCMFHSILLFQIIGENSKINANLMHRKLKIYTQAKHMNAE